MVFAESNPPALIRTSRLSPDFIRKNLDTINVPVKLKTDDSFGEVKNNWSEEEIKNERRLVSLDVTREGITTFNIKFSTVAPGSVSKDNKDLVVSCIRWEEKDLMVVTSVDIILVLESLVGEPFSVDEKSRIRRNLQFLKPSNIARSTSGRLFNSLMAMENPRPRNIEKDVKVFKWENFFEALNKVLSKYSANPAVLSVQPKVPVQVPGHATVFYSNSMQPPSSQYVPPSYEIEGHLNPTTHAPLTSAFPIKGDCFTNLPIHMASQTPDPIVRNPRPRSGFTNAGIRFLKTEHAVCGIFALGKLPGPAAVLQV